MVLVCTQCYEIYSGSLIDKLNPYGKNGKDDGRYWCPKTSCIGVVVAVDEMYAPIIIELNKKGYNTTNCCSGHSYDSCPSAYISFDRYIKFDSLPDGWSAGKDDFWEEKHTRIGKDFCQGYYIDNVYNSVPQMQIHKAILTDVINVLAWVEELPPLTENYKQVIIKKRTEKVFSDEEIVVFNKLILQHVTAFGEDLKNNNFTPYSLSVDCCINGTSYCASAYDV